MNRDNISIYGLAFLCIIVFGVIGLSTIGFINGLPVGLIIGIIVGLLVTIIISLEKIYKLLNDILQYKNKS